MPYGRKVLTQALATGQGELSYGVKHLQHDEINLRMSMERRLLLYCSMIVRQIIQEVPGCS